MPPRSPQAGWTHTIAAEHRATCLHGEGRPARPGQRRAWRRQRRPLTVSTGGQRQGGAPRKPHTCPAAAATVPAPRLPGPAVPPPRTGAGVCTGQACGAGRRLSSGVLGRLRPPALLPRAPREQAPQNQRKVDSPLKECPPLGSKEHSLSRLNLDQISFPSLSSSVSLLVSLISEFG